MIGKTRTLEWNATDEHKSSTPVHKQIRLSISLISWYTIWENNSSVNSCFESQNGTNGYFFSFSSIIGQKRTCARKKKNYNPQAHLSAVQSAFQQFWMKAARAHSKCRNSFTCPEEKLNIAGHGLGCTLRPKKTETWVALTYPDTILRMPVVRMKRLYVP